MKLPKILTKLRNLFRKDQAAESPAPNTPDAVTHPEPLKAANTEPATVKPDLSLPRLALAVLQEQVGKKQAFQLARAYYGADGAEDLTREIARARRQWLPKPGSIQRTTDGKIYAVAPDGSFRRVVEVAA